MSRIVVALLAAFATALAGCGGAGHRTKVVTIPAYGQHPQTTVAATQGSPAFCRHDAAIVARDARRFIVRSGPDPAYPADADYVDLRQDFGDFEAHSCAPSFLGPPLRKGLSGDRRRRLVSTLPAVMAEAFRAGLR